MAIRPFLLCASLCAAALLAALLAGRAMAADPAPLVFDASKIGKPNSGAPAELWRPAGAGPFPAVVVLHGCSGVSSNQRGWAGRLAEWGYVALLVDSFRPRNVTSTCYGGGVPTPRQRAQDAFNAATWLRTLPDIVPDRIGVIGFSHGGSTVMEAVLENAVPVDRGGRPFSAAVAYYPGCGSKPPWSIPATDTLILIGKNDDWASAPNCEKLVAGKAAMPHAPQIKVYPNAVHAFDGPGVPRLVGDHMEGGDREAALDSYEMTRAFLAARLKPQ
jgi:dienelactone hydrolase